MLHSEASRLVPGRGVHQGMDKGLQELKTFLRAVDHLVPQNLLAGFGGAQPTTYNNMCCWLSLFAKKARSIRSTCLLL